MEERFAIDPAFLWLERQNRREQEDTLDRDQVLLGLRAWQPTEYGLGLEEKRAAKIVERYESELLNCLRTIRRVSPDTEIIPFCMHKYAVGGNDRVFYRRILREFPEVLRHLEHRHQTPASDYLQFQRSRAVLAMRFHSMVFALGARVPFRVIDYTRGGKIAGLLADLGLDSRREDMESFDGEKLAIQLLSEEPLCSESTSEISRRIERCRQFIRDAVLVGRR